MLCVVAVEDVLLYDDGLAVRADGRVDVRRYLRQLHVARRLREVLVGHVGNALDRLKAQLSVCVHRIALRINPARLLAPPSREAPVGVPHLVLFKPRKVFRGAFLGLLLRGGRGFLVFRNRREKVLLAGLAQVHLRLDVHGLAAVDGRFHAPLDLGPFLAPALLLGQLLRRGAFEREAGARRRIFARGTVRGRGAEVGVHLRLVRVVQPDGVLPVVRPLHGPVARGGELRLVLRVPDAEFPGVVPVEVEAPALAHGRAQVLRDALVVVRLLRAVVRALLLQREERLVLFAREEVELRVAARLWRLLARPRLLREGAGEDRELLAADAAEGAAHQDALDGPEARVRVLRRGLRDDPGLLGRYLSGFSASVEVCRGPSIICRTFMNDECRAPLGSVKKARRFGFRPCGPRAVEELDVVIYASFLVDDV